MADAVLVIVAIAAAVLYLLWVVRRRFTGRRSRSCCGTKPRTTRVNLTLGGQPLRKR